MHHHYAALQQLLKAKETECFVCRISVTALGSEQPFAASDANGRSADKAVVCYTAARLV